MLVRVWTTNKNRLAITRCPIEAQSKFRPTWLHKLKRTSVNFIELDWIQLEQDFICNFVLPLEESITPFIFFKHIQPCVTRHTDRSRQGATAKESKVWPDADPFLAKGIVYWRWWLVTGRQRLSSECCITCEGWTYDVHIWVIAAKSLWASRISW